MRFDYQVLQAAAQWFAVLQSESVTDDDRQAWRCWVEVPEHARAWQRVEQISGRFEPIARDPFGHQASALLQHQPSRRRALKALSVLLGGGVLTLAGGAAPWRSWTADQRTAVGEVRDWHLPDGSQLWLNTDSAVDVAFETGVRNIALYRGELLIQAVDEQRPVVLRTAEGSLKTRNAAHFSVMQRDGATQLSVFEGTVEVRPTTGRPRIAVQGQQVGFDSRDVQLDRPAQAGRQAWTTGVLLADNLRLDDFVAELSRYRPGYLGCDPRIAGLRVVGAYPLADTERVLDVLASTLGLRVNRRMPWWVSLEPAQASV
ncbi:FecR domain-containing protein [Stutzerimonas zhaodongensis]|uniref:FecR domain-containing protein n=1 Tax=Stutzerimonas zhaodongensis TaxID=1176257 RepID=UPI0021052D9F|nr:FecR domain-containing protein [Stutzerimonas zhaodongensis]